jgi:hypothetical protein
MSDANTTGIERRGNDFAIVRYDEHGVKTELVLPEASILALARSFPRLLQEQVELKQTPQMAQQGILPVIRAVVARAAVNLDMHGTEVMVRFVDVEGNQTHYGVPPDLAQQLGELLLAHAAEAKKAGANRSKQ